MIIIPQQKTLDILKYQKVKCGKFFLHFIIIIIFSALYYYKSRVWDFPGGSVVKNPPANAGDMGSGPVLGRSHMLRSN